MPSYFLRVLRRNDFTLAQKDRSTPSILIALALCSALIIVVMGWTRDTARAANGYLIYGHFALQDEHGYIRRTQIRPNTPED